MLDFRGFGGEWGGVGFWEDFKTPPRNGGEHGGSHWVRWGEWGWLLAKLRRRRSKNMVFCLLVRQFWAKTRRRRAKKWVFWSILRGF